MATDKLNIAELVEQMPDTDIDIQAKKKAAENAGQPTTEQKDNKKPKAEARLGEASKFTGPEPEKAAKIFETILGGGSESLLELLGIIRDPSDADFKNYKAGYVLHGLAIYVGRPDQAQGRRQFAETLAAQLNQEKYSKAVRGYFIRELQVAGGKEVISALAEQLNDEELCQYAVSALLAIQEGVGPALLKAFSKVKGRNRIAVAQALGALREKAALAELQQALSDADAGVRIASAWALANIGEAAAASAVIKLADNAVNWERIQVTKACLVLAEKLQSSGNKAEAAKIYTHLRDTRTDPSERYIRTTAEKAL